MATEISLYGFCEKINANVQEDVPKEDGPILSLCNILF